MQWSPSGGRQKIEFGSSIREHSAHHRGRIASLDIERQLLEEIFPKSSTKKRRDLSTWELIQRKSSTVEPISLDPMNPLQKQMLRTSEWRSTPATETLPSGSLSAAVRRTPVELETASFIPGAGCRLPRRLPSFPFSGTKNRRRRSDQSRTIFCNRPQRFWLVDDARGFHGKKKTKNSLLDASFFLFGTLTLSIR